MIKTLTLISLGFMFSTIQAQKLELKWKTDTVLRVPESVLFDRERNVLYVANIDGKPDGKDGNGFIRALKSPFKAFGRLFGGKKKSEEGKLQRITDKDLRKFETVPARIVTVTNSSARKPPGHASNCRRHSAGNWSSAPAPCSKSNTRAGRSCGAWPKRCSIIISARRSGRKRASKEKSPA